MLIAVPLLSVIGVAALVAAAVAAERCLGVGGPHHP
jgi:hypothetical protein